MRAVKMNKRSVYHGISCLHCHRGVKIGDVVLASTYYLIPAWPKNFRTHSLNNWIARSVTTPKPVPDDSDYREIEVRVVYHRRCLEKILSNAPVDSAIEIAEFEEYRSSLLDRYGVPEA